MNLTTSIWLLNNATLLYTRHVFDQSHAASAFKWRMHLQRVFTASPFCNEGKHVFGMWWKQVAWHMNTDDTRISHATHFPATSSCFKWIPALLTSLLIDHFAQANLLKVETTILYMMLALSAATLKELDCEHLGPTTQNRVTWKIKHRENWCLCTILLQQLYNLIMTSADGMW